MQVYTFTSGGYFIIGISLNKGNTFNSTNQVYLLLHSTLGASRDHMQLFGHYAKAELYKMK